MLYVTTRNTNDAFTSYRTLVNDLGPDGGSFIPFRMPVFTHPQLARLKDKSFSENVADILNIFFSTKLNGWDLDLDIGRNFLRVTAMNHRIVVAELWHNLEGNYSYLERMLFQKIAPDNTVITNWPRIAIRIAVMFGIYGQLMHENMLKIGENFDFTVRNDDLISPIAALYCQNMGMPVNTVICACDSTNNLWDFIHRGFVNTAMLNSETANGIERLLHLTFGSKYVADFGVACENKRQFSLSADELPQMNKSLFCSVSGKDRAQAIVSSLYRTNAYHIDDEAALSYGGLQDYRAKIRSSQLTIILSEKTPVNCLIEAAATE